MAHVLISLTISAAPQGCKVWPVGWSTRMTYLNDLCMHTTVVKVTLADKPDALAAAWQ